MQYFDQVERAGQTPIYAFWHNQIFLGTHFFRDRGIVLMSSISFDGEYMGRSIKRFGYGTVRGSSTRRSVGALVEMIRLMRAGCPAGFAVDGPKGPIYEVKEGALMLAKKTGNPVVPFTLTARRYRTINSWDRLQIPMPFTTALVIVAAPIYVDAKADDQTIAIKRDELQAKLDHLRAAGEAWRVNSK